MKSRAKLGLLLLLAGAAAGQEPTPPTFSTSVEMVQVDVVVTDSDGRHVADLEPQDFVLRVDGKEKPVTYLTYVESEPADEAAPPSSGKLRREDVRRTIVFVIDELHTSPANMVRLVPVVRRFIDEQVAPGDLVSVMAVRESMGIYEQFSSDKQKIQAGLDSLVNRLGQSVESINQPSDAPLASAMNAYFMELYHGMTVAALSRAIAGLKDMPGRKAIVLFSDGIEFPYFLRRPRLGVFQDASFLQRMMDRTDRLVDLANSSGVVFYTFDSKGLVPTGPEMAANLQGMPRFLASETGGIFTTNTNGLSEALGKAMDDMTGYYLLGYQPTSEEFEQMQRRPRQHNIRVRVTRDGLRVRSRQGFTLREAPPEETSLTREDYLREALFSPFDTGGVGLTLSPAYSSGASPLLMRAGMNIDGHGIESADGGDADARFVLDVVVAAYDVDNNVISSKDQRYTIDYPAGRVEEFAEAGFQCEIDIELPKPGIYQLRAAVRDVASGATGSAGRFVRIPDSVPEGESPEWIDLSPAGP